MYDLLLTSGHGGTDPGAVGSKYTEHELVVKINNALANAIKKKSYASVKVINEKNSSGQFLNTYPSTRLWHSSHLNGANDKSANGSEIIIDNNSGSKDFLSDILKVLEKHGFKNRGIKNNEQLYVLNYDEVLNKDANHILEWGFVTNDADVKRLLDNLDKIVNEIADLYIEQYDWKKKKTSGGNNVNYPNVYTKATGTESWYNKYDKDTQMWLYEKMKRDVPTYNIKTGKRSGTIPKGKNQLGYYWKKNEDGIRLVRFFSNGSWHYFEAEYKN